MGTHGGGCSLDWEGESLEGFLVRVTELWRVRGDHQEVGRMWNRTVVSEMIIHWLNEHLMCTRHLLVSGIWRWRGWVQSQICSDTRGELDLLGDGGPGSPLRRKEGKEIVVERIQVTEGLESWTKNELKESDKWGPLEEGDHACALASVYRMISWAPAWRWWRVRGSDQWMCSSVRKGQILEWCKGGFNLDRCSIGWVLGDGESLG